MAETKFRFRAGSRIRGNIDTVTAELKRLEETRGLTAENVVRAAKSPKSVLHKHFEWDDKKAGAEYRLSQARQLIDAVVVSFVEGDQVSEPVRAFVATGPSQARYQFVITALANQESREALLKAAFSELAAFSRKYKHLNELAEVFRAAEVVRAKEAQGKAS